KESSSSRSSPRPACGERSTAAARRSGEGVSPSSEFVENHPHPLASLAISPRKRGEVKEFAAPPQANRTVAQRGRARDREPPSRALDLLDDRIPLGELVLEVLVRALRAIAGHRLEARLHELLLERLVGPFLLRHLIESLKDRLRRADRGENPEEDLRDEMVETLLVSGRDVGRRLD